MRVSARGWSRDHGAKLLLGAELEYGEVRLDGGKYSWEQTYIDVIREERPAPPFRGYTRVHHTVQVASSQKLSLNGDYLIWLELDQREIKRLFRLTHGEEEGRRTLKSLEEAARSLRELYGS